VGGRLAVMMGAVPIAESWGMSSAFIGLTVLAIGTSLPELATSAVAAYRRNTDIAVGNVVGSNIFNIFIVLGISGTVRPIPFQPVMNVDLAMVVFSTVLLFVFMFVGHPARTIQRREGALFVALYLAYIAYITNRG
jgi:cation:H+ antiporter